MKLANCSTVTAFQSAVAVPAAPAPHMMAVVLAISAASASPMSCRSCQGAPIGFSILQQFAFSEGNSRPCSLRLSVTLVRDQNSNCSIFIDSIFGPVRYSHPSLSSACGFTLGVGGANMVAAAAIVAVVAKGVQGATSEGQKAVRWREGVADTCEGGSRFAAATDCLLL